MRRRRPRCACRADRHDRSPLTPLGDDAQGAGFRPCAIVPCYRHHASLPGVIAGLRAVGLPVFVIDDGGGSDARAALSALDDRPNVTILHRERNGGKGAAVKHGLRAAYAAGFTHALQLDSDGQHDPKDLPYFLAQARAYPRAAITGKAVYDESVPKVRKFGRWLTHALVWVETLSLDIADSMVGYRIYPLAPVNFILRNEFVGDRMDFDTEIIVLLHWYGVPVINMPTRVIYPADNPSNFRMLADNVRMTLLHARLLLQMPFRIGGRALANALKC